MTVRYPDQKSMPCSGEADLGDLYEPGNSSRPGESGRNDMLLLAEVLDDEVGECGSIKQAVSNAGAFYSVRVFESWRFSTTVFAG